MAGKWKVTNDDGLWCVESQHGPWWTLTGTGPDAHICNATGRPVKADGEHGRRLRKVLAAHIEATS